LELWNNCHINIFVPKVQDKVGVEGVFFAILNRLLVIFPYTLYIFTSVEAEFTFTVVDGE
jgi:hypothetical protein